MHIYTNTGKIRFTHTYACNQFLYTLQDISALGIVELSGYSFVATGDVKKK